MALERDREVLGEPLHTVRADAERGGQRDEVRVGQIHALARIAVQVLVVADHPVAAVLHDHRCQRDALLLRGGELAAGI
jgi:hypothetical protein